MKTSSLTNIGLDVYSLWLQNYEGTIQTWKIFGKSPQHFINVYTFIVQYKVVCDDMPPSILL